MNFIKPLAILYKPNTHIPALDGIRGFAILLVLLYHCFPTIYTFGTGLLWIGVDLFFVLSGFLITGILLESKGDANYFRSFFLKRSLRIFPLYYLFLFVFFIIVPLLATEWIKDYAFYYENQWWYWLYIPNWLITFQNHWPPVLKPILDHFWSLAIEEQFYLFWPFVVFLLNRMQLMGICCYLIFQSILLRNIFANLELDYTSSYVFTFARLDSICLGSIVAILIRNENQKRLLEKWTPVVLYTCIGLLGCIIIAAKSYNSKHEYFIRFGYTVVAFLFASVLVHALSDKSKVKTLAEHKVLKWFGKYSYGIYVYHFIFYLLMIEYIHKQLSFVEIPFLRGLLASLISTIFNVGFAFISWHLFEKQVLNLKKYI